MEKKYTKDSLCKLFTPEKYEKYLKVKDRLPQSVQQELLSSMYEEALPLYKTWKVTRTPKGKRLPIKVFINSRIVEWLFKEQPFHYSSGISTTRYQIASPTLYQQNKIWTHIQQYKFRLHQVLYSTDMCSIELIQVRGVHSGLYSADMCPDDTNGINSGDIPLLLG